MDHIAEAVDLGKNRFLYIPILFGVVVGLIIGVPVGKFML
jgi:tetrahydromethanopterin S-methyltransferase subunit G